MALIHILMVIAILVISVNSDYCDNPCFDWNGTPIVHTMCLYRSRISSSNCNKVQSQTLKKQEINEILDTHNYYRALVASGKETRGVNGPQPGGTIGRLEWDKELATIAQRWAMQCVFGHDGCRNVDRFNVGQNVGYGSWSDKWRTHFSELVKDWYDEVKDYDNRQISNFQGSQGKVIGHYTQLIWANTTLVGCGGIRYIDERNYHRTYLVCDYGPAGNRIGDAVYISKSNKVMINLTFIMHAAIMIMINKCI